MRSVYYQLLLCAAAFSLLAGCSAPALEQLGHVSMPAFHPSFTLQVRPTLLNSQEWLRFWVEEHLLLPGGTTSGTPAPRQRRTISLNSRPGSNSGSTEAAAAAAVAAADGGATRPAGAAGPSSQAEIKAIRWVCSWALPVLSHVYEQRNAGHHLALSLVCVGVSMHQPAVWLS
jgi:hypothetical protein